jgi:tetratricopeptide (TPR) repeat protein
LAALDPSRRTALAQASEQAAYFEVLAGRGANAEQTIREAIDIFVQAGGANPSPTARRNIAKAYRTLARVQESEGKIEDAVASSRESMAGIETLLSRDPKNAQYQTDFHQGLTFEIDLDLLAGGKEEAHRQIERALAFLSPLVRSPAASSNPLVDYSWILVHTPFPDQQNPTAAVESAARAVTLTHESDPEILEILGLAYVNAGKRTQARETLQKALSLIPSTKPGAPVPDLRKTIEGDLASLRP